ncbi:TIGR03085 family metal-binding protein [Corynebacterium phocae]|nr:TIGR03085 family metal-binding protein [Corynebacterium phocae]
MSFSSAEREKLAALLLELGPAAPTLCGGWDTREMAAHLWLREHHPRAAAGIVFPFLSKVTEDVMREVAERDYAAVVSAWAAGPKKFHPLRFFDSVANFAEHFVHHEDVRRANGMVKPREFSTVVNDKMYKTLTVLAPRMLTKSTKPVALFAPGYPRLLAANSRGVTSQGSAVVTVMGAVPELLLWVFGRDEAEVVIKGDDTAIVRSSL